MSKKGNFEKPPKKRKNLTDNWKAIFWCFCCCFFWSSFFSFFFWFFCLFFFVFFFFLVFFVGGFKGQVRWPKGPPHLTLNPPYFFCFVFAFLFFVLFFFCLFWRVKGSGEVAQRATSLGPKPSLFVFLVFLFCSLFCFLVVSYRTKNLVFPPEKGFFIYFQCFSFFLPLPFWASLFFCFSCSVSLFSSFLSFFLLVFVLAFFWFLVFVSFFFFLSFSFFFAFLSWKEQHQNIQLQVFLACHPFSVLRFLFFLFQVPFCYLSSFLILSYVFCSTSRFLVWKQRT